MKWKYIQAAIICLFILTLPITTTTCLKIVFRNAKAPGPPRTGRSGTFDETSDSMDIAFSLPFDCIIGRLESAGTEVKAVSLNKKTGKIDSARWHIEKIPCGSEMISADIWFSNLKEPCISIHSLWYEAAPNLVPEAYDSLCTRYGTCFREMIRTAFKEDEYYYTTGWRVDFSCGDSLKTEK